MLSFEWDPDKNAINLDKHGMTFERAVLAFEGRLSMSRDTRRDYGEDRWVCLGEVEGLVVVIVWTMRGPDTCRIISARRANAREEKAFRE